MEELLEEKRALDQEAAQLAERRKEIEAEIAEIAAKIAGGSSSREPSPSKRRRRSPAADATAPMASTLAPREWSTLAQVQAAIAEKRAAGKLLPFGDAKRTPRVYVDGCFDMMHSGHMNAVRQAKLIAESVNGVLVVGVHTDVEIEANKGPPVMRDAERLALIAAVKWVDELVFDTPYTPTMEFLDSIDADFVVHGDDITGDTYTQAQAAGRLKIVKRTEGVSTTDLVGRLLLLTRSHHTPALPAPQAVAAPVAAANAGAANAAAAAAAATAAASATAAGAASLAAREPTPADADVYTCSNISKSGVSAFLPTTWRLRQFSNGRVAGPSDRIVYVDGCFDLLHAGHVAALYAARSRGDFLLVGLHDDATVNASRGENQPICSLHERALCMLALGCVDEVILGAPAVISTDLIRSMNIHIVVDGCDEAAEDPPSQPTSSPTHGASPLVRQSVKSSASPAGMIRKAEPDPYAVPREMGILSKSGRTHPLRMADIVARIIQNRARYEARNAKREKKELNYISQKVYVEEL